MRGEPQQLQTRGARGGLLTALQYGIRAQKGRVENPPLHQALHSPREVRHPVPERNPANTSLGQCASRT